MYFYETELDLGWREVLKYFAILLKYPTFEDVFHISMVKSNIKSEFLYICTKKVINISLRKL